MGFKISSQPNAGLDDGVWADYDGSRFLVAFATNVRFMRIKQRLEQPHRQKIERGSFDPAEQRRLLVRAMAEGILLGWENVEDENGEQVPYSVKAAEMALANDDVFRDFIMEFSINIQNYRNDQLEHEGNS